MREKGGSLSEKYAPKRQKKLDIMPSLKLVEVWHRYMKIRPLLKTDCSILEMGREGCGENNEEGSRPKSSILFLHTL